MKKLISFASLFCCAALGAGLQSISVSTRSLAANQQCTVTVALDAPADTGGQILGVNSSSSNLAVPSTVTVAPGATTATFSAVAASSIIANEIATITATDGTNPRSKNISLTKPYVLSDVATVLKNGVAGFSGGTDLCMNDGWVAQGNQDNWCPMRKDTTVQNHYLLRFDPLDIPSGAVVASATLNLHFGGNIFTGGVAYVDTLSSLWTPAIPGGATWKYSIGTSPWTPPNGDLTTAYVLAERNSFDTTAGGWGGSKWYTVDVKNTVQRWANGDPNGGWAIHSSADNMNQSLDNMLSAYPPSLTVTWSRPNGADVTPPFAITDLTATLAGNSVTLTWTATGNDGNAGTAARYDVRYLGGLPPSDTNWTDGIAVANPPAPQASGTVQTLMVTGLGDAFQYCFAIKVRDEMFNWSPVSNAACIMTPNRRGTIASHPRLLVSTASTWEPGKTRLQALLDGVGSGQRANDLGYLESLVNQNGTGFESWGDNAGMLHPLSRAFLYLIYKNSNASKANGFADPVIDWMETTGMVLGSGAQDQALAFEGMAICYDWMYDRIVARGKKPAIISQLKRAWTSMNSADGFISATRESVGHNYAVPYWSAKMAIAIALTGDDADAASYVNEAAGILGIDPGGWPVSPTVNQGPYIYNLKQDAIDITGGALNWEGPTYWRSAAPEILRAYEHYDSATNRTNAVWNGLGSFVNAGLYKIYTMRGDHDSNGNALYPGVGDAFPGTGAAGRDNFAMVILVDRLKDDPNAPQLRYWMDHEVTPAWDAGSGGELGLVWKLIFYPYVNGPSAQDYSSLPLSRQFGQDFVMRTGWGSNDTHILVSANYNSYTHRHSTAGEFQIFKGATLTIPPPYVTADGDYYKGYMRRSIGANVVRVYDPSECWRDNADTCGRDYYGLLVPNDGGQRLNLRAFNPPYSAFAYDQMRIWSSTMLSDPVHKEVLQTWTGKFKSEANYDYINLDLSKAYTNNYSGQGKNTNARTSLVTREFAFLRPNYLVVFDRVTSTNAGFKKTWNLHTVNEPQVNNGSGWVTPTPGIQGHAATKTRTDNGTSRLFMNSLLPANSSVRTVGGNTCTPIPITGATLGNPGVFATQNPHGLQVGEYVATTLDDGSGGWGGGSGIWVGDGNTGCMQINTVPDPQHFTLKNCFNGRIVDTTGFSTIVGKNGRVQWHSGCGWEGWLDDDGTGVAKNVWYPRGALANVEPRWRAEVKPATDQTADYFLNVLYPTSTSVSDAPASSLIDSTLHYGAQIPDAAETYVAMFTKSTTPATAASYTSTHSGAGRHVVMGMAAGTYNVAQNGAVIATPTVSADGSLTFDEVSGGTFTISQPAALIPRRIHLSGEVSIHGAGRLR